MISDIIPHINDFLIASVVPDGDSNRVLTARDIIPQSLSPSDLPAFIPQFTGINQTERNSMYGVYNIALTISLFYAKVGQTMPITTQYDLYSYADKVLTAFTTNTRLIVSGTPLSGLERPVVLSSVAIPTVLQYPEQSTDVFSGARFTIAFNIRVNNGC